DLRARTGRHGETLFGAPDAVRSAELLDSHAVNRQRQPAFGGREGDSRRQAARIAEGGEIRTSFGRFVLAGAPIAARGAQTKLELCDQVLEAVGLVRKLRRALTFLVQRLLALRLLPLALIGQQAQALAFEALG